MEFQSTFPRGERREPMPWLRINKNFNPRSRVGNDVYQLPESRETIISIHVPAWGTTLMWQQAREQATEFQSTFPRGERPKHGLKIREVMQFQSTFPRGERLKSDPIGTSKVLFQSTFPRGERPVFYDLEWSNQRFQSTFPRGERRVKKITKLSTILFQSTFPRGERHLGISWKIWRVNFNPRSRVGNDCKFSQIFFDFLCNKYNFSTFYYPFSLFFGVIHFTFLIFVVRILPVFYVYFWFALT